jgi:WD40 repeat protein
MQRGQSISRGTGFLVGDGLVLTALHVVADRKQESLAPYPGEIVLTFPNHSTKAVVHENYWDRLADWALLRCETTPPARPLPLAELRQDGLPWETYGFPDANPRDGLVNVGEVSNSLGKLEGMPVFQLYSREAAAGQGEPVKGLSGSPVLIQNAVVGLLRFALMTKEQQTVAGTVYACPVAAVLEKCANLLPLPDPCFGLPGLPRQPLPAEPFRYLAWFTEKEAEVFFGRNREIRQMYDRLTAENASPVILLYGQAGVGKSSFLDAGLVPRLRWYHEVGYVRRDARSSLLQTLLQALHGLGSGNGNPPPSLAEAWKAVEERASKPLVVFFDQLEEIYTLPNPHCPNELEEFVTEVKKAFEGRQAPKGRLVLSFRKEWFPEIQKQMEVNGLSYEKVFLEGLGREAVNEIVTGLTQTERLRQFYGLKLESHLQEIIANDLVADPDSPIAPTLQILLTKMWKKATTQNRRSPEMTVELYQSMEMTIELYRKLREEGLLLQDFLDQQLEELKAKHAEWCESGLALDVLACHTTPLLTAKERTQQQLIEVYRHRSRELPELVQALQDLFLLSDSSRDGQQKATRLGHDTMAPVVRQRFDASENPGQRARHIIESRVADWTEGSLTGLLDEGSLSMVEGGASGMRVLTDREQKLIEASRKQHQKRQRNRLILRASAVAALVAIVAALVYAILQNRIATKEKQIAQLRYTTAEISNWLSTKPVNGLLVAIDAIAWNQRIQKYITSEVARNLGRAMDEARERLVFPPAYCGGIGSDGTIAFGLAGGSLQLWSATTGKQLDDWRSDVSCVLVFSPDGREIAWAGTGGVVLWARDARKAPVIFWRQDQFRAAAFSPPSDQLVGVTDAGVIRVSNVSGQQIGEHRIAALEGKVMAAAIVFASSTKGFIVAGTDTQKVYLTDLTGKLLAPPFQGHRHPLRSVALTLTAEGELAIASGDVEGNLLLWDRKGQLLADPRHLHEGVISALAFNPEGRVVATAGIDGVVNFLLLNDGNAATPVQIGVSKVTALAFSPDGRRLLVTSGSGSKLIDTHGIRIRAPVDIHTLLGVPLTNSTRLSGVSVGSKGTVAVSERGGGVVLWNPSTGYKRPIRIESAHPPCIVGLVFSSDESILATGSADGQLRLWDNQGNALGEPWNTVSPPRECPQTSFGPGNPFSFDLEPGGKLLVTADGQRLRLWDTRTRRELHSITDERAARIRFVKFTAAGSRLVTSTGRNVRFWRIQSDRIEEAESPEVHLREEWSVFAVSPGGKSFVTGNKIGQIGVWRPDGSAIGEPFNPHDANQPVLGAVSFPDGKTTASFIQYGEVIAFSGLDEGKPSLIFSTRVRRGSITAMSLSPDGKTLAIVGGDTLLLVHANWEAWLETACDRLSKHPVFQDAANAVGLNPEVVQGAKKTCQSLVWNEKPP